MFLDCQNNFQYHLTTNTNSKDEKFKIRSNAIGSIEKQVARHLKTDVPDYHLKGNFVRAYCDLFGCSPDFLFGLTEIATSTVYIREFCANSNLTREFCANSNLTEESIRAILELTKPKTSSMSTSDIEINRARAISTALICKEFAEFIVELAVLHSHVEQYYSKIESIENNLKDQFDCKILRQAEGLEAILDELYTGPQPSPEVLAAVHAIQKANDQYHDACDSYQYETDVSKFKLNKLCMEWIDSIQRKFEDYIPK